jgi:DNA-binding MarR family transcriptional regulator
MSKPGNDSPGATSNPGSGSQSLHLLADIDQVIHAPARLMVLSYLYVVESADFIFLMRLTGLTWGNLSTHLSKLEEAGYVAIVKGYKGKKPHTLVRLTEHGRVAFREYKRSMQRVLDDLPD